MKLVNSTLIAAVFIMVLSCGGDGSNNGDTLFSKGQYAKAISAYNAYLESNSNDVKTLYNRGRAYQELGKLEEAEADFMTVLKADEKNLNAHLSLSKLFYSKELYNKAVLWAEQGIKINENSSQAQFLAARAKHQLGYVDGALESYTLAIKINSDFGEAYLYRGALKVHMKRTKSACADFRKAQVLEIKEADSALAKYCK